VEPAVPAGWLDGSRLRRPQFELAGGRGFAMRAVVPPLINHQTNTLLASRVLFTCAICALLTPASRAVEVFVRPLVAAFDSSDVEGADDSFNIAGGVTAGVYLGATHRHEVSLEIMGVSVKSSARLSPTNFSSTKEDHVTLLHQYRYHIPLSSTSDRIRFFVGPAIGAARTETERTMTIVPGGSFRVARSKWYAAWGLSAGLNIRAGDRFDLEVGVRRLQVDSKEEGYGFDDFAANGMTFGVGFRF
jgi:hypothetical protein